MGNRSGSSGWCESTSARVCDEIVTIPCALDVFDATLIDLRGRFEPLVKAVAGHAAIDAGKKQEFADSVKELLDAVAPYEMNRAALMVALDQFGKKFAKVMPGRNDGQHAARQEFAPIVETIRGLVKQVDLLYKLAARVADLGRELVGDDTISAAYDRREAGKQVSYSTTGGKPPSNSSSARSTSTGRWCGCRIASLRPNSRPSRGW